MDNFIIIQEEDKRKITEFILSFSINTNYYKNDVKIRRKIIGYLKEFEENS